MTYRPGADAADDLDGCDLDFNDASKNTRDGDEVDAVVMFADVFDDPDAVEARRAELVEWAAAAGET